MYHDYEGEITYSVIVPEKMLSMVGDDGAEHMLGITESYHEICGWIVNSLAKIGIHSEFKPINDIVAFTKYPEGQAVTKKISGNAQTRRGGVVLQHGTILYTVDVRKMFSLLKVGKEKIADKLIAAAEDRVTSVVDVCVRAGREPVTREALYEALKAGFTEGKKFEIGTWSLGEIARAKVLSDERYTSKEWNWMR